MFRNDADAGQYNKAALRKKRAAVLFSLQSVHGLLEPRVVREVMDGKKWLAYLSLSAVITMAMGIENALEKRTALAIFALLTFLPVIVTKSAGIVGVTGKNGRTSVLAGISVGLVYGTVRGLFLKLIPASALVFGADLARIAAKLGTGIELGSLVITSGNATVLLLLFMFPFMIAMEMYFRGLLFLTAKRYAHWTGAVAISSAVQAVARRTPHSLIMGSIGGVLMQRYDNILAPSFMHGVQFFTALAIVLYL